MMQAVLPFNSLAQVVDGVDRAIEVGRGIAGRKGFLFVSGSLYTIGEALRSLEGRHGP
jgi:folylpolyglutamate synthase/dihydropteroate synthase